MADIKTWSVSSFNETARQILERGTISGGVSGEIFIFNGGIHAPNLTPAKVEFEISGGLSDPPIWHERRPGLLAPALNWTLESDVFI